MCPLASNGHHLQSAGILIAALAPPPRTIGEHADRTCRRLHVAGTSTVVAIVTVGLLTHHLKLLSLVPLLGYGFAWAGHFFFEHNRPATFKHPVYSLMGDFKMWWEVVTRQRPF